MPIIFAQSQQNFNLVCKTFPV